MEKLELTRDNPSGSLNLESLVSCILLSPRVQIRNENNRCDAKLLVTKNDESGLLHVPAGSDTMRALIPPYPKTLQFTLQSSEAQSHLTISACVGTLACVNLDHVCCNCFDFFHDMQEDDLEQFSCWNSLRKVRDKTAFPTIAFVELRKICRKCLPAIGVCMRHSLNGETGALFSANVDFSEYEVREEKQTEEPEHKEKPEEKPQRKPSETIESKRTNKRKPDELEEETIVAKKPNVQTTAELHPWEGLAPAPSIFEPTPPTLQTILKHKEIQKRQRRCDNILFGTGILLFSAFSAAMGAVMYYGLQV